MIELKIKPTQTHSRMLKILFVILIGLALLFFQKKINITTNPDDIAWQQSIQQKSYAEWITQRYTTWSSRVGAETAAYFLVTQNLVIWKTLNVLMIFLLAYSVTRTLKKKVTIEDFVFVLLTLGFIGWRILTSSSFCFNGSLNYLWPLAMGIFALIPLADSYFHSEHSHRFYMWVLYALSATFAILSNEQLAFVLLGLYGLYVVNNIFKKKKVAKGTILFLLLIVALVAVLVLSPGNHLRYQSEILKWYPDFNKISLGTHLIRDLSWFYGSFFSEMRTLVLLLGFTVYYIYLKKIKKRSHLFEGLLGLYLGFMILSLMFYWDTISGIIAYPTLLIVLLIVFWTLFFLMLLFFLSKLNDHGRLYGVILMTGLASMLLLWASPTIFASGHRVLLICSVFLVILINKLRLDNDIKVNKILIYYLIPPLINLTVILFSWRYGFVMAY